MTDKSNDLSALWQSGVEANSTENLLAHVENEERSHQHIKWFTVIVNVAVVIAVAYIELTGAIKVPGVLAAIALGSAWIHWNHYHAKRKSQQEIASLSPRAMLEHALKEAIQNLALARGMHTLFPGGAVFGYLAAPLIVSDRPWYEPPEWLDTSVLVILLSVLVTCVVAGHWIARKAKQRIRILEARLKEYDESV